MTGNEHMPVAPRTQSRDTGSWAERILLDHWRSLQPWEKAELVADLSKALHRLSLAGLAARFPDACPEEMEIRAACLRLGPELSRLLSHLQPEP